MTEQNQIVLSDRSVRLSAIEINDADVADFFKRIPEDDRILTFINTVQVGVFCLARAQTSRDTDFVRRQIEFLLGEVTRTVEKIPGATQDALLAKIGTSNGQVLAPIQSLVSQVTAATATRLQEVKDLLSQDIDPTKESSTLGRALRGLKDLLDARRSDSVQGSIQAAVSQITGTEGPLAKTVKAALLEVLQPIQLQLNSLASEIKSKDAVTEALSHTTLKGLGYEEEVLQELYQWARSIGAQVDHVGADNQPGDVIVRLSEDSISSKPMTIVIEVRDRQNPVGRKVVNDALTKAMDARQAHAAIYLSRTTEGLAQELGEWGEGACQRGPWVACSGPQLLTAIRFLIVQNRLAGMRSQSIDVDSQSIEAQLQRVRTSLDRVKKISRRVGEVRSGADDIQEEAENLRDEVKCALASIDDAIRNVKSSNVCDLLPAPTADLITPSSIEGRA